MASPKSIKNSNELLDDAGKSFPKFPFFSLGDSNSLAQINYHLDSIICRHWIVYLKGLGAN